jgi:hypothetical protein
MGKSADHLKYQEYYKKYNHDWYLKHRKEILREEKDKYKNDPAYRAMKVNRSGQWTKANPEKRKLQRRRSVNRYFSKLRADWGYSNYKIGKAAEILAAHKILPSLGFSNIIHVSGRNCHLFFDIFAKKDNIKYGIQVTTRIIVGLRSKRQKLVYDFLGLPCLILFVKPTLDYYRLIKASKNYYAMISSRDGLLAEGSI